MLERHPKEASESKTLRSITHSNYMLHIIIGLSFLGAITWDHIPENVRSKVAHSATVGMAGISIVARFVNRNAYLSRILGPADIVTAIGKIGLDPPAKDNLIVHMESPEERNRYNSVKNFIASGNEDSIPIPEGVVKGIEANAAATLVSSNSKSLSLEEIVSDVREHELDIDDPSEESQEAAL